MDREWKYGSLRLGGGRAEGREGCYLRGHTLSHDHGVGGRVHVKGGEAARSGMRTRNVQTRGKADKVEELWTELRPDAGW